MGRNGAGGCWSKTALCDVAGSIKVGLKQQNETESWVREQSRLQFSSVLWNSSGLFLSGLVAVALG